MTTVEQIISKLRETGGNVQRAAADLKLQPQGIYYHVNRNPEVAAALAEIRKSSAPNKKSVAAALRRAKVDPDEVALVVMERGISKRTAAREMLEQQIAEATNRSKRDVVGTIRGDEQPAQMFERKLPAAEAREEVATEVISVSLTEAQHRWVKALPRGSVGKLIETVTTWPSAGVEAGKLHQTTFSIPVAQLKRLRDAAAERDLTSQALLRAIIEEARQAKQRSRRRPTAVAQAAE